MKIFCKYFVSCLIWYGTIFSAVSQEFSQKIDDIINNSGCYTGVVIYSTKKEKILYEKNAEKLFTPASTTKLFVAAAAMYFLGFAYQFSTVLATDGKVENGVLHGNLFLKGTGDPSLSMANIKELLKVLAEKGIQQVQGNFYVDYTYFDTDPFAPGTTIDDLGERYFKPVGGLMIDDTAAVIEPINRVEFIKEHKLKNLYIDAMPLLRNTCATYNVAVNGDILAGQMPQDATLISEHKSDCLFALLQRCLKESDNTYANCLCKRIGSAYSQQIGSWDQGVRAIKAFLEKEVDINPSIIKIVEGSGLSRYNLITPCQLVQLLRWIYDSGQFEQFLELLPIAGVDGTLKTRLTDYAGKIKAKTGTLGGVSVLSGYALRDDDVLIFAIMNNGYIANSLYNPPCKSQVEDAICAVMLNGFIG
jgi:D-alanyl-D-alanine carboxypeptidase